MFYLNYKNSIASSLIKNLHLMQEKINKAHQLIEDVEGEYKNFLGWLKPKNINSPETIKKIKSYKDYILNKCEYLLLIGIGGSYLGSRALIESIKYLNNKILYAGQTLDCDYNNNLLKLLNKKRFAINVISKSGNTAETIIIFNLFKELLEKNIGEKEAKKYIIITTDKTKGPLRKLANKNNYKSLNIPKSIGGRYSVLSPVGLFPMSFSGINIDELLKGANEMRKISKNKEITKNNAYLYAAIRNQLYNKGYKAELLATSKPSLYFLSQWWKQLFAESEGKDEKGLIPIICNFTTDLHSIGQMIQGGQKIIFETIVLVESSNYKIIPLKANKDFPHIKSCINKDMHSINNNIIKGVSMSHIKSNIPHMIFKIPKINEYYMGALIYFFQKSCAISAILLGVHPFDQPNVDMYKYLFLDIMAKEN